MTTIRSTGGVFLKKLSYGRISRRLVHLLHAYSQLHTDDLCVICERASILTPALRHSLYHVSRKCRSCAQNGRPHRSKKVSLSKLFETFNDNIQIDFMWITELTLHLILHTAGMSTSYFKFVLVPNREILSVKSAMERRWFHLHGRTKRQ